MQHLYILEEISVSVMMFLYPMASRRAVSHAGFSASMQKNFAEECCFAVLKVMQPFLMLLPGEFLLVDRRISFCATVPVFFEFFSLFRHISNPL